MVLESILNPNEKLERRPWMVFLMGFIYSSIAVILSLGMFRENASLVMVFLTVFASIHLVYVLISKEEKKDMTIDKELTLLEEHGKVILIFISLFLGFLVSYSLWGAFLPEAVANDLFTVQIDTINGINNAAGKFISPSFLPFIIFNNLRVLIFCVLFSFVYGAGAIFILTWNASVGGAFVGNFIRTKLLYTNPFHSLALGMVRYLPHGILEMAAYFVGGLAGGIISVAIINHDFGSKSFLKIIFDASELLIIAVLILLLAALVEVFVTPQLMFLIS